MKISEAFNLYCLDYIRFAGGSRKTEESYEYTRDLLIDYFSNVSMSSIRFKDIREWRSCLEERLSPDTVRGCIVNLRCVLRMLITVGDDVMDFTTIRVPKRQKRIINFLTSDEVDDFVDVLGRESRGYCEVSRLRNIAIGRVLASSGIRVSELCSLNRNSIKGRKFTIIGKSRDPRICFIDKKAEKAISKYMEYRTDKDPALFLTNYGNRIKPGNVRRIFQTACENSDFESVTPHTLRHSLATTLLDRRVDIRYIADILGHQSLDTTRMYTHYSNTKLQHIYDSAML